MTEPNDEKLRELLRKAIPPVDTELKQDLWLRMLRKLDERAIRVSWYDWALIALVAVCFLLFPEGILGVLYHL